MAILSKAYKPDNLQLYYSLNLSFTNVQGLRSNFVNLSLNQTLCETNLDDSIDSGNLCERF